MSALYMARLCFLVFFGELKSENAAAHESPWIMAVPMLGLGALTLLFGFTAPDWLDNIFSLPEPYTGFASYLAIEPDQFHSHFGLAAGSTMVALVGIAIAWAIYRKGIVTSESITRRFAPVHKLVANKYYLDDLYQGLTDRVLLAFSNVVGWFDRHVVNDTGVDGTGSIVREAGNALKYHETGQFANYALAIVFGSLIFILAVTLAD